MKKREKAIISGSILVFGSVINLFFTAALHGLLSRTITRMSLIPLSECIAGLFQSKQQLLLFLSFEGFLVLLLIVFFVQNTRSYQSDLVRITDDIYTPAPVGQYQHGSSRWLKPEEKGQAFGTYTLDPAHPLIKQLLKSAYDFDFLKKGAEMRDNPDEKLADPNIRSPPAQGTEPFDTQDYDFTIDEQTGKVTEGTAAPPKEVKQRLHDPCQLLDEGGIVVGMEKDRLGREKIYYIGNDTHALTIGATRSGKTRCLVLQTICTLGLAGESMLISDPKAEIYHYTASYLEKLGYEVICLDFKNPEKSSRYNLLQPIISAAKAGDMEKAEMYAWDMTNILVGDNVSNEKIWENGEKSTIAAAILCVVIDNMNKPDFQNLTNVYWFIGEMCKTVGNKSPIVEYVKKLKANHPAKALLSIAEVAPSRTRGSFYTSALTTLRLFTSKSIYHITKTTDYDISQIGSRKQALFIILPDERTTYYSVASLIVSQLYEVLVRSSDERGGRLRRRVNFVLDEFGNFAKLNDLPNKLTVAGGRGARFQFYLQSFRQLDSKYDEKVSDIVKSNAENWIYLQADDKATLQEICEKLGKYTCSAYQLSAQHGRYVNPSSSHSISLIARDLLTTDEIRRVSRPNQIVVSRTHPAMMNAPDLSQWLFNRLLGLGDKEHNRMVREERERKRPVVSDTSADIKLWGVWEYYAKDIKIQEGRQKQRVFSAQTGAIFSEKAMYKGGSNAAYEEE